MIRFRPVLVVLLLCAVPSTASVKKGWVMLRDDLSYNLNLISKAPEYHVNHIQLSHDIVMYAWQPINDPSVRSKINQLTQAAHANGVTEVVIWVHDIQFTNMPSQYLVGGKVNLDNPGFWTWLEGQYDQLFSVCPDIDGIVLTFSENFEGADFFDRKAVIHTGKTPTDTLAQAIATIWSSCSRHGKSLYVRTWAGAGADRWVRDAILRNDPAIWMMSKATGAGDWNVIQEDYDIIGTCTGHPEMVEFDVCGEYWGMTYTPWAGLDYIKHLWSEFALPRGADGVVARVDRASSQVLEGPNRINMYALDVLADAPETSVDQIYSDWCLQWFGPAAAERVASALKRTFDITNSCYGLPTIYPFSADVARDYCLRSLYDIDYVSAPLKAASNYQSGKTNYQVLRQPLANAAGLLGLGSPSTLFGDFAPAYSTGTSPTCTVYVVDADKGLNPSSFRVDYSTDGGATWTGYSNFGYSATGGSTAPYRITANSVPFGSLRAAANKIRFRATNLSGTQTSRTFTVRGLDYAQIDLGTGASDGIYHPQGGDGDTIVTTAGGRSCRRLDTLSDTNFYFQVDDGFAYDRSPSTLYLQVDYYGSWASITPIYDSVDMSDRALPPVYLGGSSSWRTATWRLDDVNFGNRAGLSGSDFRLYVPSTGVFISGVRLYYSPPPGMLPAPQNVRVATASTSSLGLTWDPAPGAVKYQVCRGTTCIGWPTATSYLDGSLVPNIQRTYTVTAYDGSGFASCSSAPASSATLSRPPSQATVSCSTPPQTWQTSPDFTFTATGGFGASKAQYYRFVWDESPTHAWTGGEPSWPAEVDPPKGPGWSVWTPTALPTDDTDWLLYDGSTTQRCVSEQIVTENGTPAWKLADQGRVQNTKAKLAAWPDVPLSRDTGATLMVRMKAADSPVGWSDSGWNFGFNLPDCEGVGVVIRPDWLQITGPSAENAGASADNGCTYHTYTLTMKNAVPGDDSTTRFSLYRDGQHAMDLAHGPASPSPFSGPMFGHSRSNATGTWYFEYLAWRNDGAFAPASSDTLTLTAPHNGSMCYLHVQGFNVEGVPNGTADLGPYCYWNGSDQLPPVVTDDGAFTTQNAIHATWTPAVPSPDRYEYAIGSSPGAQDVLPFTDAGLASEVTCAGLSLVEGQTYYVSARGVIGSTPGPAGVSDGMVAAPRVDRIGQAKALPDGSPAALYSKLVTAVYSDCAYVQEDHSAAIRVVTSRPIALGQRVDLAGTLTGSSGERAIVADAVFANP